MNVDWNFIGKSPSLSGLSCRLIPDLIRIILFAQIYGVLLLIFFSIFTGTAWAPDDDDDDDGSYGNLTPPADKGRPSVGTLQLYHTTPPSSVSTSSHIFIYLLIIHWYLTWNTQNSWPLKSLSIMGIGNWRLSRKTYEMHTFHAFQAEIQAFRKTLTRHGNSFINLFIW